MMRLALMACLLLAVPPALAQGVPAGVTFWQQLS
jgi:hypothetical protein